MLNQVIVVGRLVADPEVKKLESGKEVTNVTLAVNRPYKNAEGVYETDFIDCVLWEAIALNTAEYCRKGDVVGIRGRLETNTIEQEDGIKKKYTNVIAEKVTFLSSKPKEDIEKEKQE